MFLEARGIVVGVGLEANLLRQQGQIRAPRHRMRSEARFSSTKPVSTHGMSVGGCKPAGAFRFSPSGTAFKLPADIDPPVGRLFTVLGQLPRPSEHDNWYHGSACRGLSCSTGDLEERRDRKSASTYRTRPPPRSNSAARCASSPSCGSSTSKGSKVTESSRRCGLDCSAGKWATFNYRRIRFANRLPRRDRRRINCRRSSDPAARPYTTGGPKDWSLRNRLASSVMSRKAGWAPAFWSAVATFSRPTIPTSKTISSS